jgi:formylglycine-generating enzyme required for sulfatase activity
MRYGGQKQARKFSWGAKWPPPEQSGNFADRSAIELVPSILPAYDDGYASTAPVGSFKPNSLGIYDGGGNVAEWVNDFYTVPTPGITTPSWHESRGAWLELATCRGDGIETQLQGLRLGSPF